MIDLRKLEQDIDSWLETTSEDSLLSNLLEIRFQNLRNRLGSQVFEGLGKPANSIEVVPGQEDFSRLNYKSLNIINDILSTQLFREEFEGLKETFRPFTTGASRKEYVAWDVIGLNSEVNFVNQQVQQWVENESLNLAA